MKVLCNLVPLGASTHGDGARTGVFRVAKHLVHGLANAPECETWFHPLFNLWQSWRYYEKHLRGPRTHFATAPWRLRAARHLVPLERTVATTIQNRSLPLRATRYAFARYVSAVDARLEFLDDRVLREIDVYHSPFWPIPESVKRHRRVRRFTTIYDLIPISHPEFFGSSVVHLIHRIINGLDEEDHAICISHATRHALLECVPRLDPAKVSVATLAAAAVFYPERDAEKIAAVRRRIGLPSDAPYFLSVGTLEPRKNLDAVIRAFARLRREGEIDRSWRLVLVGNMGWKTERIFAALEDARDCRDVVLLTGFVPDEELAALYTGARAFAYMARIEGFGLPPLEAMQCGTPVITSNTSSLPEVVGDAGIQLAPDDLDGLCNTLLSLATDDARHRDLSARAIRRAAGFGWDRFLEQNLAAYRIALAS